jgi:TatA/E family protein of Tat protein translocase
MELQLLVILVVALLLFGPEKMMEFAVQMGRLVRRLKQEWAQLQMELEMRELRERWKKDAEEGEKKVRQYLEGKTEKPTIEELVDGKAPVVDDDTEKTEGVKPSQSPKSP